MRSFLLTLLFPFRVIFGSIWWLLKEFFIWFSKLPGKVIAGVISVLIAVVIIVLVTLHFTGHWE